MTGYTPVFRSIFEGSLCGQYPDTAAWLFMLALADKNGLIDKTPQYISSVTGMPVPDLVACIERFMQPDPMSRSHEADGRRLVLIDPSRQWGWRIVNHSTYREKARKQFHNQAAVESGANQKRMTTRRDQTRPDLTDSHTHTQTQTHTEREGAKRRPTRRVPEDFQPDRDFALAAIPDLDVEAEIANFRDCEFKTAHTDWPATWRRWIRTAKTRGQYAKPAAERAIQWR